MTKRIQLRTNLLRHSPGTGVSGAGLSHIVQKTTTPAPEKIILRTKPKTMKTLLGQSPNRMNGKTGKLALMNRPYMKTQRTVIIFHSPRTRQASATKTLSCPRHPSSRSASSAGFLGAALSHVVPKTTILVPEKIILRTMLKTMKTPSR